MKEFERKVEELKEVYVMKPEETINGMNDLIFNLKFNTSTESEKKKISRPFIGGLFAIAIILIGLVNVNIEGDAVMIYYFGSIFFLAGLFASMSVPSKVGVIVLFSHGCTGLGLMNMPKAISILKSPIMTDGATEIKQLLIIALVAFVLAIICAMLYNISKKFKEKDLNYIITLALFLVSIAIIQFLPIIYNIPINSIL